MTLSRRLRSLEKLVPTGRSGRPVAEDAVAFARGLLSAAFGPEDIDPHHANHTGWLTTVVAFLGTLTPENQTWEAEAGITALATCLDAEGLAVLDAVMRRG